MQIQKANHSDVAKSDAIKSQLRIRWPNLTTRPVGLSIRKMAAVFNQVKI